MCEVGGAIGLHINRQRAVAAIGISTIMVSAVYFRLVHTPLVQGVPALVVLSIFVFVSVRKQVKVQ
jgi:putative oxidoreductase